MPSAKPLLAQAISIQTDSLPYSLEEPSLQISLASDELKEISGLSPTSAPGVFCAIADEKGEIYFIDSKHGGKIIRQIKFLEKGDFEGIEKVKRCLYAVKSKGVVYQIAHWNRAHPIVKIYKTPLSKVDNVEGLCYDSHRNALLLACKGNPDSSYHRPVYAFDLRSKQLDETPVFTVDPLEVNKWVPYNSEDKPHFFSPSGIAIHPLTGEVYIISTAPKRLIVLDYTTGKILHAVRLDKKLLPQPEGIAFDPEGNLYLSSEGKKGEGLLLRFNYKK